MPDISDLSACKLGSLEGEGWSEFVDKQFQRNMTGIVYFDPSKRDEVKRFFDQNRMATYTGKVLVEGEYEERTVEVPLESFRDIGFDLATRHGLPHDSDRPRIVFFAPGNPFEEESSAA